MSEQLQPSSPASPLPEPAPPYSIAQDMGDDEGDSEAETVIVPQEDEPELPATGSGDDSSDLSSVDDNYVAATSSPARSLASSPLKRKRSQHTTPEDASSPQHAPSSPISVAKRAIGYSRSTSPSSTTSGAVSWTARPLKDSDLRNPNRQDRYGQTLLFRYVYAGDHGSAQTLLQNDADPNIPDGTGNGPLNSACLQGDVEMVQLLLNHGARINHHGDKGDTPLHDAVANEHEDVVRILLSSGANPMIKNKGGETSIDVCDSRRIRALLDARKEQMQRVRGKDKAGKTNLHRACNGDRLEEVKELLGLGADVNVQDNAGWTPLHEASLKGHLEIVKELLGRGAKVDVRGLNDDTPVHDAAANGHAEVVRLLLEAGADPRAVNANGETPMDVVEDEDIKEMLKEAIAKQRGKKRKSDAADMLRPDKNRRGSLNIEKDLGSRRRGGRQATRTDILWLDPSRKDAHGRTQLHQWASQGDVEMVGHLLEGGAVPNTSDSDGRTPLHLAARYGHLAVAELLLAYGADVEAVGREGETPLMECAGRGHLGLLKVLLLNGAQAGRPDKRGQTAVEIATDLVGSEDEEIEVLREAMVKQNQVRIDKKNRRESGERDRDGERFAKKRRESDLLKELESGHIDTSQPRKKKVKQPEKRQRIRETESPDLGATSDSTNTSNASAKQKKRRLISGNELRVPAEGRSREISPLVQEIGVYSENVEMRDAPAEKKKVEKDRIPVVKKEKEEPALSTKAKANPVEEPPVAKKTPNAAAEEPRRKSVSGPTKTLIHGRQPPTLEDAMKYLPLYTVSLPGEDGARSLWLVHAQFASLLGLEQADELFKIYPSLQRKRVSESEKERLWSPLTSVFCGKFMKLDPHEAAQALVRAAPETKEEVKEMKPPAIVAKLREVEKRKFLGMPLDFIKLDEVVAIIEKDFTFLSGSLMTIAVDITYSPTVQRVRPISENTGKEVEKEEKCWPTKEYKHLPMWLSRKMALGK
ncbi:hypothetical protein YB2330_004949 [Saitoella coloradoensis]